MRMLLPKLVDGPRSPTVTHHAPNRLRVMRQVRWAKTHNALLGWVFFLNGILWPGRSPC